MTSTNDGKDVKSNQPSGQKSKTYYIELYTSLEKALGSDSSLEERTRHVCEAWRRVYSLYQHSATSTHPHLLSWLQRHTANTVLQSKWAKSKCEQARLTEAIDALIAEATSASNGRQQHTWEETLLQRAAWFRKAVENPWDNPVLKSLINPNSEPVTDQQVLEWLISEHGIVLVTRLQRMVAAGNCDDLALLLASAVMDRARAAMPHLSDEQADLRVEEEDSDSFVAVLEREASFTPDEWEMLTDIELVLLLKTDKRPRCIELAKLAPLRHGYKMVERLRKRLETSPRDKKLWKHAKEVATIVTQVLIARCMVLRTCAGAGRDALYWCARALARLLAPPALRAASTALAAPAATARHLHTFCAALSAECKELKTDVIMKPFICELYVRAITAGMNELEQLKLNAEKEAEARLYEQTLAGWFTQLGGRLTDSVRLRAECALTAFSVHPARKHYERVANTQPPRGLGAKQEPTPSGSTSEYGSWANDSRTQSNLVKTSETLQLKQSEQHQANVLSTAILTEGETLGLEPELCQDLAVLLSGPRVKTLSWDMDREVLLKNCRAYMEKTHGGTRAVTTELKYLNLDLNAYQHLPEEDDDENDVFYGIEKGYEHEVQLEEPEEIWQNAFFDPELTESANESEVERGFGKKKSSESGEDEDPLSTIADAKKEKKKRAKEKDKEQRKKKTHKVDESKDDSKERQKDKEKKTKKERKKDKSEQVTTGSLNSLLGMKVTKTSTQVQDGEKRVRKKKERRRESTFSYVSVTDNNFDSQEKLLQTSDDPNVLVDGVFSMDELKSPERLSVDSQKSLDNTKTTIKTNEIINPVIKTIKARPASSLSGTTSSDSDVARSKSPYLTPNQLAHRHVVSSKVKSNLTKLLQFRRNQNKMRAVARPPPVPTPPTPTNSLVGMKIYNPDEVPKVYLNKKQSKQLEALSDDVNNLMKEVGTVDYNPKTSYNEMTEGNKLQRLQNVNVQEYSQQQHYNNPMHMSQNKLNETLTDSDNSQHRPLAVDNVIQSNYASPTKTTELVRPQALNPTPPKPTITYQPFHKSMQNLSTEKHDLPKKPLLINDPHYFSHQHAKSNASQLSPRIISNTVIKPPIQTATAEDDFPKSQAHSNIHRTYMTKPAQNINIQTTNLKSEVASYGQKQFSSSMQNINEVPSSIHGDKRQIPSATNMLQNRERHAKPYSVISHSDALKSTQALHTSNSKHTSQSSPIPNRETVDTRTLQKSENDFDEFLKELVKSINAGTNGPDKNVTVDLNKEVKMTSVQMPSSLVKRTDSVTPQSAKQLIQQKKTENAPNTFSRLSYLHKNKQIESKVKLTDTVTLELNKKIIEHKLSKAKYFKNEVTLSRVCTNPNTQDRDKMIKKIEPSSSRLQRHCPVLSSMLESPGTPNMQNYSNMPTSSQNSSHNQPNREDADLLLLLHNQTILKPNPNVIATTTTDDTSHQSLVNLNSQSNVETRIPSTQQTLLGTKVKNINILGTCSKKDSTSDDNEWKRVMDAIIARKTEPLGPNALDLALKKDQRRHTQSSSRSSGKPRVPGQSSSQTKSSDIKKREHHSSKANSTSRKSITNRHSEVPKKPRDSEIIKKVSPEMLNRLHVQNRLSSLNMTKELQHTSVITNSDYDMLEDLIDDDLRQELGEISSDEDSYSVQNASLAKGKIHKNIPKSSSIVCKTTSMHKEKPHVINSRAIVGKNQSNLNMTDNNIRPVVNTSSTSSYPTVIINNSNHPGATHIENRITEVISETARQYAPSTTVITNQVAQDTANNILTHVEANQYINNILPTNVIIASVPQPAPVVVIRQNLVYDPYPTIRIHENQINPTVFAVNTAPNLAVYQTTQFAAPIINPIIIGNATTNTNVSTATAMVQEHVTPDPVKEDLNMTDEDSISLETALRLSDAISETPQPTPNLDFNMNRNSERKVLTQVYENHTNEVEKDSFISRLSVDDVSLKSEQDVERIKLKRQSLINRKISHAGGHPPIALTYTPLYNKVTLGKLLQQEVPKSETIKPNLRLLPNTTNEVEAISSNAKSPTSETNNENIGTTDQSSSAKENKKTCRRIWLRSSNKLSNKKVSPTRPRVLLKRNTVKSQVKHNAIENITDLGNQNKDSIKIPTRTSNRKPNKKKPDTNKPSRSTETQKSLLDFNELIDFEKELDSSIVLKSLPAKLETENKSVQKPELSEPRVQQLGGVENTEHTSQCNKLSNNILEPTVVIEKLKNQLGDQLLIKSTSVKTSAKDVNVIAKNREEKKNLTEVSFITKESSTISNKINIKATAKPAAPAVTRSSLRTKETNKLNLVTVVDQKVIKQTPSLGSSVLDETNKLNSPVVDDQGVIKQTSAVSQPFDDEKVVKQPQETPVNQSTTAQRHDTDLPKIGKDETKTNTLTVIPNTVKPKEPTTVVPSNKCITTLNATKPFNVSTTAQKHGTDLPQIGKDETKNNTSTVIPNTVKPKEPTTVIPSNKCITSNCTTLNAAKPANGSTTAQRHGTDLPKNGKDETKNNTSTVIPNTVKPIEPTTVIPSNKCITTLNAAKPVNVSSTAQKHGTDLPNIGKDETKNNTLTAIPNTVKPKEPTTVIPSNKCITTLNAAKPANLSTTAQMHGTDLPKNGKDETKNNTSTVIPNTVKPKEPTTVIPSNKCITTLNAAKPANVSTTAQKHGTDLPKIGKDETKNNTLTAIPNTVKPKEPTTVIPSKKCITTLNADTTTPTNAESKINNESDPKQPVQLPSQNCHSINTNTVSTTEDDNVEIIETSELNASTKTEDEHSNINMQKCNQLDEAANKDQQKTTHTFESLLCKENLSDVLNDKSVTNQNVTTGKVHKNLDRRQSNPKQPNITTKPDIQNNNLTGTEQSESISKNHAKTRFSNSDNKEKTRSYMKGDLKIEEVPLEDPNKKLIRISLPNGKVFKVTIYGNLQGDIDSLIAEPTIRAILSGASQNDGKRYTLNYKQIQRTINGDPSNRIREIKDLDIKEAEVASTPVDTVNLISEIKDLDIKEAEVASTPVDTVNLISDDEEEIQTRSFDTEFGRYTTNLDQETIAIHQKKFDQKCEVKIYREDLFKSNRTKPKLRSLPSQKSSLMTRNKSKLLLAIEPTTTSVTFKDEPDLADKSTHAQDTVTPLLKQVSDIPKGPDATDVIEIDDSSNDSLENQAPETVDSKIIEPVKDVTAMASLLLQSLGVETDKPTIPPVPIKNGTAVVNLKSALLQDLGIVPVVTPVIDITTNDDEIMTDIQRQNKTSDDNGSVNDVAQNLDQNKTSKILEQFNLKKCAIRLIKCENLIKKYELIKTMKKCYVKIERYNNSLLQTASVPALSEKIENEKIGDITYDNVEDLIEFDIDDPCSSPQLSRCPSLSILNNWDDDSQPNLESPYCTSPVMEIYDTLVQLRNKLKTELIRESEKLLSSTCDSEWTFTKYRYSTQEFMLGSSHERETENLILTPSCDKIKDSSEAKLVMAFETPKLLSITLKFLQDNPDILYRLEFMRKREIISKTITIPNKLKRKTEEVVGDTVASKILKLGTLALNTVNSSFKTAVIIPNKVEDTVIRQSALINVGNSNVTIIEAMPKYKSTVVANMEDENQLDELLKTDNNIQSELHNEEIKNKLEEVVYFGDCLPSNTEYDINTDISEENRDVTSPSLLCDYTENVDGEKIINMSLINRERDELSHLREIAHFDNNMLNNIQKGAPPPLSYITETNDEEKQMIIDVIHQQSTNDNPSDEEISPPPLCDNNEISEKEEAEMCKPLKEEENDVTCLPSEINYFGTNTMEENKELTSPPSLSDSYEAFVDNEININHSKEEPVTEQTACSAATSGETDCLIIDKVITEDNDQITCTPSDNIVTGDKKKQMSLDVCNDEAVNGVSQLKEAEILAASPSETDSFIKDDTEDNQEVTFPPALSNNTETGHEENLMSNNDNDEKATNDLSQMILVETSAASHSATDSYDKEVKVKNQEVSSQPLTGNTEFDDEDNQMSVIFSNDQVINKDLLQSKEVENSMACSPSKIDNDEKATNDLSQMTLVETSAASHIATDSCDKEVTVKNQVVSSPPLTGNTEFDDADKQMSIIFSNDQVINKDLLQAKKVENSMACTPIKIDNDEKATNDLSQIMLVENSAASHSATVSCDKEVTVKNQEISSPPLTGNTEFDDEDKQMSVIFSNDQVINKDLLQSKEVENSMACSPCKIDSYEKNVTEDVFITTPTLSDNTGTGGVDEQININVSNDDLSISKGENSHSCSLSGSFQKVVTESIQEIKSPLLLSDCTPSEEKAISINFSNQEPATDNSHMEKFINYDYLIDDLPDVYEVVIVDTHIHDDINVVETLVEDCKEIIPMASENKDHDSEIKSPDFIDSKKIIFNYHDYTKPPKKKQKLTAQSASINTECVANNDRVLLTEESAFDTVCSSANEDLKLENTSTDHCEINKSDCTLKSKPDCKYELIQEDDLLTVKITTENDKVDSGSKSVSASPNDIYENTVVPSPCSNTADNDISLKGFEFEDIYVFPLSQAGSNNSNVSNDSLSQELNTESVVHTTYVQDDLHDIDYQVKEPEVTYSRKRKMSMRDVRVTEKKYRKGKNIDCSKQTQFSIVELAYSKEYKRLLEYCSSVKFSYSRPFHKECVELEDLMGKWPVNSVCCDIPDEVADEHLFLDLEDFGSYQPDPATQTFVEEISYEYDKTNAAPENPESEASEANFNMGFGEGSGRVIQILKKEGESNISAATLSDVKQSQPVFKSVDPDDCNDVTSNTDDQIKKIRRHVNFIQLRDKVRQFFEKSAIELKSEWMQNTKDLFQPEDFPFGLCNLDFVQPLPTNAIVHVVQVGQLPVSAAAQNPVTCDPRVTQVSDASPSQCSVDNSPNDDSQSEIKTEYTELTTADLTLPLQEYAQQNQTSLASQDSNVELVEQTISLEMEIKAEDSSEIKQEMPDITEDKSNSSDTDLLANATSESMDYAFEKNTAKSDSSSVNYDSSEQNSSETFSQQRQQNGTTEKTDQIAHAMNAAGITTTPETVNNTRAHALVNILSQKIRQGSVNTTQTTTNTYSKTTSINAMSLQQALAQILPPPLNQTGSNENNQNQSTSVGPQVLHIVQGKNASGNQITLVDNSQQSVISTPNATQVLHIVQNKNTTTGQASNGTLTSQGNSFSGLSLVDAGLQQGGNQLLHIVNTGNQKTASPGQLLKRVNLLTNLTNVQGSNEQKMVQFVCKSADGKAIQLNAPHQRSMVLRLQPIETPNVQNPPPKPADSQEPSPSPTGSASSKESASQQEIKSRSIYEENYAKFIQNSSSKTPGLEKSTSLPKFNQAFGKPVFQEGSQKQGEAATNNSHLPPVNANSENAECPANDNAINMEHMGNINSPPLLIRKPVVTTQSQSNIVQQIKQTIAPMNIQTMHGGVIYTRQIPVNIGGGQTINLITVPSTELINDDTSKTQSQTNQGEIEPSIIKIVPQNQTTTNAESSQEESNSHASGSNENAQNPQPQPVLTQMRIKLPMLSKAPQMVPGARVVRPSFFQIQRNVIGGANQPVYQQLVLTAAPPLGQQTIRLPAQASRPVKVPSESQSSSSESQMSSSTLEQLREFDMVLEQVKERSTSTPSSNSNSTSFKIHTSSADTTDGNASGNCSTESTPQVLYSIGNNQSLNVAYVNRKTTVTTPTTSTYVRSPDSSGIADSPTSSTHGQIPHTVTSDSSPTDMSSQSKPAKVGSKSKSRPKSTSNPPNTLKLTSSVPPKTSSQKPLEDEQTTQRILYILAEYKEQVENSPDKDKPAPRRRSNPPSNPGSSKRKKSSSSRRSGTRDMSPIHGEDTCRTMGSEDSSCGTSQGDCTESCLDSHSPQDSPRKVARKITFDQDLTVTQPRPQPQRNVIVADGQTITVARGTTGKPATAVLMPANYILPVSMVKGGQQIAIVTNRGPKLLTVGGEGGATNALLLQRLIGPAGLKPVLTRPGVRHVRLPTAALHNLQAFNLARATTVQPPDSTASPTPGPTPPELVDTRANSSPWTDRDEVKPERGSSPEGSEPWNLPSTDAHEYTYEETVRTDNMDRTVLDPIPDRYSPDMEAQRIFDKMFDVDSKKSYAVDSRDDSPRCAYDIDPSECDDKAYQVVQKKDGSQRQHRLSHVSAAALRHKYAILEHELRLQKSLSEECEDLGVDSPSASELFPEAELLFANSPAHEHNQDHHSHTPQPHQSSVPQPDMDDQIATDHLIPREIDVNLGLGDVGIVAVSEDGSATIALDQEEFARSHPNTTFHSEPTEGEVQPFTITGLKGRHITSTIFHSNSAPATVLMTAPQATVISQAPEHSVKYEIENMINSMPSSHNNDMHLSSVLAKDGLTRFDNILTDSRELHLTNTASAIVHSSGNATQVIRRVCYEDDKRERDARYLIDEPDNLIAGDDAKMIAEDSSRDATMESMADVDDDRSSPERHAELFWESNSASERSESRRPLDFSSDSDKCCKSPSFDETNSTDSSGVGTHMRLDSVIKEARGRERSGSADGSSADDTHPPLRTYPPKRSYHPLEGEAMRSLSGKTRAGERSPDSLEVRRRASGRGVVKRGCHCCNGSPAPPRPKKPRQRKPTLDFNN